LVRRGCRCEWLAWTLVAEPWRLGEARRRSRVWQWWRRVGTALGSRISLYFFTRNWHLKEGADVGYRILL
jgi:hypothetical protein